MGGGWNDLEKLLEPLLWCVNQLVGFYELPPPCLVSAHHFPRGHRVASPPEGPQTSWCTALASLTSHGTLPSHDHRQSSHRTHGRLPSRALGTRLCGDHTTCCCHGDCSGHFIQYLPRSISAPLTPIGLPWPGSSSVTPGHVHDSLA